MNNQIAEVLEAAALVISILDWWTRGTEARTENGRSVGVQSKDATCFCAEGALRAASDEISPDPRKTMFLEIDAGDRLRGYLYDQQVGGGIAQTNDLYEMTGTKMAQYMWETAQQVRNAK